MYKYFGGIERRTGFNGAWKQKMGKRVEKRPTNTRLSLIQAATRLFGSRGYDQTSISDIAREVGLSDGSIYTHFENKEELLLSIPNLWLRDAQAEIIEQLFGIEGTFNKLRKFMWWFLRYVQKDPDIAKVTFLYLKTNRNFTETEEYQSIREVYSVLLDIIEQGMESGEVRADIKPYVARQIFLGTIEHIIIRWLLKEMSYDLFDDLPETFDLITNGLAAPRNG